jgi:hypothetical protein
MNLITRDDLVWCLSPNWVKRIRIRPLITELNRRIELRNRAYPGATNIPLILDELSTQNSASLDRCWIKFNDELEYSDNTDHWESMIKENAERAARLRAIEEAEQLMKMQQSDAVIAVENQEHKEIN